MTALSSRHDRTRAKREALRRQYQPRVVRLLFVGESPPASGRHFHAGDSGLYRAIRDAFGAAFPSRALEPGFLESFRDASCALVDLCARPVDDLPSSERRARCRAAESRLAREIAAMKPRAIVTVLRAIEPNVQRASILAGWKGEIVALPYPGRWVRARLAFIATLVPLLRRRIP